MAAPLKLFDVPVSNHGARARILLYGKRLGPTKVAIISPMAEFPEGGLKSVEYLKLSPQGKMPMLQTDSGLCIAESSAIFSYLTDRFSDSDPSFIPQTAEERAISNMITCIHDNYLSGIQGCLYKAMSVEERSMKLKELSKQIDVIEHHMSAGPFVAGKEISQGDCAMFPTFIFIDYCTPKFGWESVFLKRPKLNAWFKHMMSIDYCKEVYDEVLGGLQKWDANERWIKLGIMEQIVEKKEEFIYH